MTHFSVSAADIDMDSVEFEAEESKAPSPGFSTKKYVSELRADIAKLDPLIDANYRLIINLILNPLIGVKAEEWANLLCVSSLTIHRWKTGGHLPYPIPRKGFVAEILDRLDQITASA